MTIFSPFSQTSNRLSHRKAISARLTFFSGVKSLNAWNLTLPYGQMNFASGKFSSFGRSNTASASLAGDIHFAPSAGVRYVFIYCFMMSPVKINYFPSTLISVPEVSPISFKLSET